MLEKNYWAVGSSFGGTDDRTKQFIKNENWFDGKYDEGDLINENHLQNVKKGDVLIMKSSATKGKGHKITFTKVKAVGIIVEVIDIHYYKVKWLKDEALPKDFDGISYRKIIEPLRNDGIMDYAKTQIKQQSIIEKIKVLDSKKQIILQGPPGTGKTRLAKEIAHQLIFNQQAKFDKEQKNALSSSEQFKIVQFHASYSYEDFVRGISVDNIDGKVIYETKNRILGEIAAKAHKNFLQSNEDIEVSYKEFFLDEAFDEFIGEIAEKIESQGNYQLTDKVSLINVDEEAFRYKGQNGWNEHGLRMKFLDIKKAFIDNNTSRQDIKKNKSLSSQANWHSSYYVRVLNEFQKYWDDNLVEKEKEEVQPKVDMKNYVLIIDEINRANLSSVLGELIYALEYRGEPVESLYELKGKGREIVLPNNLFIIGTMNTADRSVGHIDYAIRRRFAFESVLPQDLSGELESGYAFATEKFKKVKALFIVDGEMDLDNPVVEKSIHLSDEFDPKDVCIGHSYFIYKDAEDFNQRIKYEIKPILEEYIKDGVLKESLELRDEIASL